MRRRPFIPGRGSRDGHSFPINVDVEEGSLARTFVESRRILNCLPRNVALSPARHRDIGNLLIHFAEF